MSVKWGVSVLDWRSHAIDDRCCDHPAGVYEAECGHTLMMVVSLHDEPNAPPCPHCAASQLRAAAGLQLARAETNESRS